MAIIKSGKNASLETILGMEKAEKKKFFTKKKIIISSISIVLVGAITFGTITIINKKKATETQAVFREYTAQRGDILVGLEESSVITLNQEEINFPVEAEVLELYVKSGSKVKKGDKLVKMSTDDIDESLQEYENEITDAETSLAEAKLSRETELKKAKQELESNVLEGDQSEGKYSQTIEKAKMELEEAEKNADEAQEKYDDNLALSKTFSADYKKLNKLEDTVDNCEIAVDIIENLKEAGEEAESDLKNCESKIKDITDAANYEQAEVILSEYEEEYDEMLDKYSDNEGNVKYSDIMKMKDKIKNLSNSLGELKKLFAEKDKLEAAAAEYDLEDISKKLTRAQKKLNTIKTSYENFKENFNETYGNISSQDDMDKALSDSKTDLQKAKLTLKNQETQYEQTLLSAQHTKDSSDDAEKNAQLSYNLKKIQLDEKVKEAQDKVTQLKEDLAEIKESIGNDGILTATCDGIVSKINVEEGDTVTVSSGDGGSFNMSSSTSVITITDMSSVNVSVSISEDEILDVALDGEAVVTLDAFTDETFDAVVSSISTSGSTMGASTVTYTVTVTFEQEGHEIYEGMSADVNIISASARDCVYISKQAITTKDGASYVYLKDENGDKIETKVVTGFTDGQFTEILSGLNEGDVVLAESKVGVGTKADGMSGKGRSESGDFDPEKMSMPFDASNMGGGPK